MSRLCLYDEIGANAKAVLGKDYVAKTSFDVVLHPLSLVLANNTLAAAAADVNAAVRTAAQFNRDGSVSATLCPTASWRGTRAGLELTSAKDKKMKASQNTQPYNPLS
jgi:hypothetical protein